MRDQAAPRATAEPAACGPPARPLALLDVQSLPFRTARQLGRLEGMADVSQMLRALHAPLVSAQVRVDHPAPDEVLRTMNALVDQLGAALIQIALHLDEARAEAETEIALLAAEGLEV